MNALFLFSAIFFAVDSNSENEVLFKEAMNDSRSLILKQGFKAEAEVFKAEVLKEME